MDRTTFKLFGYQVERAALLRGCAVSTIVVLALGVGVGTLVDESSNLSIVVTALITVGFISGGVVAGVLSSKNHIAHGTFTAIPVGLLAVAVQLIRRVATDDAAPWLSLVFIMFLAISLGTLGGVIGGRFSPTRRSLMQR